MSTKRPGTAWLGLRALEPGALRDQIQDALTSIDLRKLEDVALKARLMQDTTVEPGTTCAIDPSVFTHGWNNIVLEVAFSDSVYWVARIQHVSVDPSEVPDNSVNLQSEIATMGIARERTTIPIPKVFTYNIAPDNEIGRPYLLMESLPGRVLGGPVALHVPPEHLPKVATQLADAMFQLSCLTFDRLGRLWRNDSDKNVVEILPLDSGAAAPEASAPGTSPEWFYQHRQEANTQALEHHTGDEEWLTACWVLKIAVSHIVVESRLRGPFPLCHLDLHHGNLLFDDEYNLVGVIDWSEAQTVPMERLAVSPEFVTFPAGADENNQKIIRFRQLVIEHLQHLEVASKEAEGDLGPFLSQVIGSKRAEITHRCTYSFPHRALWDARLVAKLIYGDHISWEQLVLIYGQMEL
ncbi:phosphotransferase enzyme family protein [Sarocladium implicatum]|nr:phosphotransferase enzyme family protein [Sarocladium implicatum]